MGGPLPGWYPPNFNLVPSREVYTVIYTNNTPLFKTRYIQNYIIKIAPDICQLTSTTTSRFPFTRTWLYYFCH